MEQRNERMIQRSHLFALQKASNWTESVSD